MKKYPRVWIARDGDESDEVNIFPVEPPRKMLPSGRSYYSKLDSITELIASEVEAIGLDLAPGQCVEYELRPVVAKRKGKQPAQAGRWAMVDDGRYNDTVLAVLEIGCANMSVLQRELQIGDVSTLRLLDRMEADGIVGPLTTTGRKILITRDQWLAKAGR